MNIYYNKLEKDPTLTKYFQGKNLDEFKRQLTDFLVMAFTGPQKYKGRDMFSAHYRLGITHKEFDKASSHLIDTLSEIGIGKDVINDIDIFFNSYRKRIVEE